MPTLKTVTIGELRNYLEELLEQPDDAEVFFGSGDISFKRVKNRSPLDPNSKRIYQFEFNDLYSITLDASKIE